MRCNTVGHRLSFYVSWFTLGLTLLLPVQSWSKCSLREFAQQAFEHKTVFLNTFSSLPKADVVVVGAQKEIVQKILNQNVLANRNAIYHQFLGRLRKTSVTVQHELSPYQLTVLNLKSGKTVWLLPNLPEKTAGVMRNALQEAGVQNVAGTEAFLKGPFSKELLVSRVQNFYFTPRALSEKKWVRYSTKVLAGDITPRTLQAGKLAQKIFMASHPPQRALVSLGDLKATHLVNFPNAVAKSVQREINLKFMKAEILKNGVLTESQMNSLIPSNLPIKALSVHGKYYIFSGNGRLEALRNAFREHPHLKIEMEVYTLKDPTSQTGLIEEVKDPRP